MGVAVAGEGAAPVGVVGAALDTAAVGAEAGTLAGVTEFGAPVAAAAVAVIVVVVVAVVATAATAAVVNAGAVAAAEEEEEDEEGGLDGETATDVVGVCTGCVVASRGAGRSDCTGIPASAIVPDWVGCAATPGKICDTIGGHYAPGPRTPINKTNPSNHPRTQLPPARPNKPANPPKKPKTTKTDFADGREEVEDARCSRSLAIRRSPGCSIARRPDCRPPVQCSRCRPTRHLGRARGPPPTIRRRCDRVTTVRQRQRHSEGKRRARSRPSPSHRHRGTACQRRWQERRRRCSSRVRCPATR